MSEQVETIRPMATIQRIAELNPIPDADRIEVATVLGWKVVVKKNEFKVGDLAVFFEVGSILPRTEWSEFLFKPGSEDKTVRLKSVRLRKTLSQGLLVPLKSVSWTYQDHEGWDLTSFLGVTKYEPPCNGGDLKAKSTRPHWVFKTDEPRVQGIPWIVDYMQGKEVVITQKLDGSSCSVGWHPEYGKAICSRNMSLDLEGDNRFIKIGKPLLERIPEGYLVQGELVGPGVQDNRIGLKELDFYAFNVWNLRKPGDSVSGTLLGYDDAQEFLQMYKIKPVPVVACGIFHLKSIDDLLKLANEQKYNNGHPQEGIVVRPVVPEWHKKIGMLSFKVINNEFLLKIGE